MIHPQAIVDPAAEIAEDVTIGPFTVIGPRVQIGSGTVIGSHNVIKGPTIIGKNNRILQFNTIGEDTPDLKFKGEETWLYIGDNNTIREGVTIHRGTVQDQGKTVIGSHNLIMAYAHIGHDCIVGDHTIIVNNGSLAGHVHMGDWAILSGYSGVHQFARIGAHSFIGAYTYIHKDVPAYVMVAGIPAKPRTINVEGLKRRGFSSTQIQAISKAFKVIYRNGLTTEQAKIELSKMAENEPVIQPMLESLEISSRSIVR